MKFIKTGYKFFCVIVLALIILNLQNSSVIKIVNSTNTNLNKNLNLNAMARVVDNFKYNDIYAPLDNYSGVLTGYAANCPLCSGKLGCTGQNVLDGTTIYDDQDYGKVHIVASSSNLKCGSIVQFKTDLPNGENSITAIVLDRGVAGTALDLLVESESYALKYVGRKRINYDVLRYGWSR